MERRRISSANRKRVARIDACWAEIIPRAAGEWPDTESNRHGLTFHLSCCDSYHPVQRDCTVNRMLSAVEADLQGSPYPESRIPGLTSCARRSAARSENNVECNSTSPGGVQFVPQTAYDSEGLPADPTRKRPIKKLGPSTRTATTGYVSIKPGIFPRTNPALLSRGPFREAATARVPRHFKEKSRDQSNSERGWRWRVRSFSRKCRVVCQFKILTIFRMCTEYRSVMFRYGIWNETTLGA